MPFTTFVEAQINDKQIALIKKFRREGRFPTACYMHPSKNSKNTPGCVIYRCAEPEIVSLTEGCPDDQQLLHQMS